MSDICIKVENLSKGFSVLKSEKTTLRIIKSLIKRNTLKHRFWALRDLSFTVSKGDKLAIIGKNGSGKTTLLRILAGIYDESSGNVTVEGVPLALFDLTVGFNQELSVIDNIYLFGAIYGISHNALNYKMDSILEMSELSHLKFLPFKELSTGQCHRVALSTFFHVSSEFIIIDEGLASIDRFFIQKCEPYFQNLFASGKTIIICSHDTDFLRRYCNRAMWLDEGRIQMDGGIDEVLDAYER